MSNLYTSSRLKVLRQCLRLHLYRYSLGIQTPSSPAARFGTVGHAALEAWYRAWQRGALEERLPDALAAVQSSDLSPTDMARLGSLVVAYHMRWHSAPWEIIGVEIEFRYELDGYLVGGKIDALIRDTTTGEIWVIEHKTTGMDASPGSSYWEKLAIDVQVSIYVDGATVLGHEIAGCIYDVLQRPKHEPKLATPVSEREYTIGKGCSACGGSAKSGEVRQGRGFTSVVFASEVKQPECSKCKGTGWSCDKSGKPQAPRLIARQRDTDETLDEFSDRLIDEIADDVDAFLIRGVVVRLDDELPRMRIDLVEQIKIERTAALHNLWPRNPDACSKFGSLCHFFGVCSGRASIDDEHTFPRGDAHPELANAA